MQQAGTLATRILSVHKAVPAQVDAAFNLVLGRPPSDAEAPESATLVATHGLAALCRVLFNTNEFLVLP